VCSITALCVLLNLLPLVRFRVNALLYVSFNVGTIYVSKNLTNVAADSAPSNVTVSVPGYSVNVATPSASLSHLTTGLSFPLTHVFGIINDIPFENNQFS
jgi:hypothetical protein